ncbi:MAG: hypothetical protein IPO45_15600 [Saprospiraceae bacterium]|uniref:hypothetical protein n=1 Tax=Candidatus Brachybacter algidus TaxID=2982024 RepID=UPI001B751414|nr:hypothetical protein [Candidatus Brachybacter algidus]MBP7538754.1 hypothetical protein [Saprospiraceae bacterium]MBK6372743.1 hypothetical protein [Candidatus Brachybacter algidus]MBK7605507.1 hypothetical protein [Candidatus Brachybacter algidus]MBK8602601.1 hypothetical protein [Candidatus Brachybacter algidus]MBK9025563.1 hypothetical protein [Candidatus Brachybacter algidus]
MIVSVVTVESVVTVVSVTTESEGVSTAIVSTTVVSVSVEVVSLLQEVIPTDSAPATTKDRINFFISK